MKTLNKMTNVDKARLLHQWFPTQISSFVEFTEGMCKTIKQEEPLRRKKWTNGLISFDFWLHLVNNVQQAIQQYGSRLNVKSTLFADQLFDGYLAIYSAECLVQFANSIEADNKKFALAVNLFFNP